MRSCTRRPTGLSANADTSAVSIPKQRFKPRATLYSPPPSHTRNCRAVWMRPSPGSSRSMTSPSATRSQRRPSLEGIGNAVVAKGHQPYERAAGGVKVAASGEQQRSAPRAVAALVDHAIVEAVGIARPELDPIGHDAEAAPERRPRDHGSLESRGRLAYAIVQRRARRERVALPRRPRAELEFARP